MGQHGEGTTFLPQGGRRRYDGSEPLPGLPDRIVLDYWRWAHSDILENVQRGIFAEYLVAEALGITAAHRVGWTGYDLDYGGYKIEVKSSAYLQSWRQRDHSKIVFRVGPRQQLDEDEMLMKAMLGAWQTVTSSQSSQTGAEATVSSTDPIDETRFS
jgi:hypothetical protein